MFGIFKSDKAPAMTPVDAISAAKGNKITLIDVREAAEVATSGKAKGAIHIPLATLRMKADPSSPECVPELKSGKPIAVYCASGARSGMAARNLRSLGHKEVHNIGSLSHWVQSGGKVVR